MAYIVKPVIMDDDGENLTPVGVQPIEVPKADWPKVVEHMAEAERVMCEQFAAEQASKNGHAKTAPNRAARRARRTP